MSAADPAAGIPAGPLSGTRLCAVADVPDGGGREWVHGSGEAALRVLLLRRGEAVWAYVNRCPHFALPLNYEPDVFWTYDGDTVMCAHHSAMFRFDDGTCYDGPCQGHRLAALPVRSDGESVVWD